MFSAGEKKLIKKVTSQEREGVAGRRLQSRNRTLRVRESERKEEKKENGQKG